MYFPTDERIVSVLPGQNSFCLYLLHQVLLPAERPHSGTWGTAQLCDRSVSTHEFLIAYEGPSHWLPKKKKNIFFQFKKDGYFKTHT